MIWPRGGADYEITYEASGTNRIKIVTGITLGQKVRCALFVRSAGASIRVYNRSWKRVGGYFAVPYCKYGKCLYWRKYRIMERKRNLANCANRRSKYKFMAHQRHKSKSGIQDHIQNTFIRDSSGALGAGDVYLIEFQ